MIKSRMHPPLKPMKHRATAAFTLVEMSIVLVIIALVVGGVILGQDLIRQNQIRTIVSQSRDIFTKIQAFRLKYGATPGEFLSYSRFFPTLIGPYCPKHTWNPGVINDVLDNVYEVGAAMAQLHAAGMIEMARPQILQDGTVLDHYDCTYSNQQSAPSFSSPWGDIWPTFNANAAVFGKTTLIYGSAQNPSLTVGEARALDVKLDDGMPYTGRIVSYRTATTGYCTSSSNLNDYTTIYATAYINYKTCMVNFVDGL